jgi:hypothetical protein
VYPSVCHFICFYAWKYCSVQACCVNPFTSACTRSYPNNPVWINKGMYVYLCYGLLFSLLSLCNGSFVSITAGSTAGTNVLEWHVGWLVIYPEGASWKQHPNIHDFILGKKELTRGQIRWVRRVGYHNEFRQSTRQAVYVEHNTEAHLQNYCYCGKAINITYWSVCACLRVRVCG